MMITTNRRCVLAGILGSGTISGLAIASLPARAAQAALVLPDQPMRLCRWLRRDLNGNAALTIRRCWEVRFALRGRAITVSGRQVSVDVDAPPNLAPLARIEQGRETDRMFPILLSPTGILMAAGKGASEGDLAAALDTAEAMIARQPIPASEKTAHRLYLMELQKAGTAVFDTLPSDLFFPTGEPVRRIRLITLPDGLKGELELTYEAHAAPGQQWLDRATRRIATRINGIERYSTEEWSLAPL